MDASFVALSVTHAVVAVLALLGIVTLSDRTWGLMLLLGLCVSPIVSLYDSRYRPSHDRIPPEVTEQTNT